MNSIRFTSTLAALALLAAPWPAHSESSDYRLRLTEISRRQALDQKAVPLLEVVPTEGREAQLTRLLRTLEKSADRRIQVGGPLRRSDSKRSTVLFATDGSWYLEATGDGSRFRYHGNVDDPRERDAEAGLPKLDLPTLERLGRDFIRTRLASLIEPGSDDQLVFLGSRYLREGSTTAEEPFTDEVVSNLALFGREVRGTFVAGPGSKIAVWFSNRREPVAFVVDWPAYKVQDQAPSTLDITGVQKLLASYGDHPFELIDRNTRRFECGYVDLGAMRRGRAPIQPGCVVAHAGPLPSDLWYGAIEALPIGATVTEDPDWPVTSCIASGRLWSVCQEESKVRIPAAATED